MINVEFDEGERVHSPINRKIFMAGGGTDLNQRHVDLETVLAD